MIEINLCERLNASSSNTTIVYITKFCEFANNKLDKPCQMIVVIYEDLKEVFNANSLLLTQLKGFELFLRESLIVSSVINQSLNNVLQNSYYFIV